MDEVQAFVLRRTAVLDMLRRSVDQQAVFMNAVRVTHQDVTRGAEEGELAERARLFACLGLSVGRLLSLPGGVPTVRAAAQLMLEFEHQHFPSAMRDLRLSASRAADDFYPDSLSVGDDEPIKPVLHRANGSVVFEFLEMFPAAASQLDYFEVTPCLCDVLAQLYRKFMDEACGKPAVKEALLRLDDKIQKLIVKPLCTSMTELAVSVFMDKTSSVGKLFEENDAAAGVVQFGSATDAWKSLGDPTPTPTPTTTPTTSPTADSAASTAVPSSPSTAATAAAASSSSSS